MTKALTGFEIYNHSSMTKALTGFEIYKLPEFRALCNCLGIDLKSSTTFLSIELPVDDVARIVHEFIINGETEVSVVNSNP